jgi:hypothetical protein
MAAMDNFKTVACGCGKVLGPWNCWHLLVCPSVNKTERHNALSEILAGMAKSAKIYTTGDKKMPACGEGGRLKYTDIETTHKGKKIIFDVRVVNPYADTFRLGTSRVKRLHPVRFGENKREYYDINVARDEGAAAHVGRIQKIKEYVPTYKVKESIYEFPDVEKEVPPEEKRSLKKVIVHDIVWGDLPLVPLVFETGGVVAPEVQGFI